MNVKLRVVVVGAGLSGLICARRLSERGHLVTVLDKARAPGGRASTRTDPHGRRFDHGAQFFTARSPWLVEQVEQWRAAGVVATWSPRRPAHVVDRRRGESWWVGTPRMSSLAAHLARGLDVLCGETVTSVAHDGTEWSVTASSRRTADALVLAMPAPQCASLLGTESPVGRFAASAVLDPCWATMVDVPGPASAFDLFEATEGPLAWAAREASKKGREAVPGHERWVVHASPTWSRAHLDDAADTVARIMGQALAKELGVDASTLDCVAHRWRYARAAAIPPSGEPFDDHTRLALCGDWVEGARIESAMRSGLRAADHLLALSPA